MTNPTQLIKKVSKNLDKLHQNINSNQFLQISNNTLENKHFELLINHEIMPKKVLTAEVSEIADDEMDGSCF
jgi:hypothetical protein